MNVSTITMPTAQARKKRAEYLRAMRGEHTKEDEALKNGFRELARGRQVVDLYDALRRAGTDALRRPRLAIVRACYKLVWFSGRSYRASFRAWAFSPNQWVYQQETKLNIFLPREIYPDCPLGAPMIRAVAPMIPPGIRPPDRKLEDYHILWEAEWEEMPSDPMLLKHLGENLYAVVAAWNLTKLERAVLEGSWYE